MSVRDFAPAKINLTLQVGAPREDGMHPLQSVVMFADVGDWVEAEAAHDISLRVAGPFSEGLASDDNLVIRAARLLDAGTGRGAALRLEKNLPVASGIGGGSSDAAAALKALNALWGLKRSERDLTELGSQLGADVPVCIGARNSWMAGIGEDVTPLHAPAVHAVLVNSLQPLATGPVFKAFDAATPAVLKAQPPPYWTSFDDVVAGAASAGNDLAPSARALLPVIAEIEAMLKHDTRVRYAALSGSGATCFGLVETRADAEAVAANLSRDRPDWWIRAATLGDAA